MKISIVAPIASESRTGNLVTATRWAELIGTLGHEVKVEPVTVTPDADLLVALHAGHSARAVQSFARTFPGRPIVVGMGGTDLYHHIQRTQRARECIRLADRLVLLQPRAIEMLPRHHHEKCRVIYQSAEVSARRPRPLKRSFEVVVAGHLRPVKDPFRAAMAARALPDESRIRIIHLGAALTESMRDRALREMERNPRYEWLGELPHGKTLMRLLRSRLLVHSSKTEGGANVVTEAIVGSVPVLSSQIPGSIGLLGEDYPGYFETGNTRQLTQLLLRSEQHGEYLESLRQAVVTRQSLFTPERERQSWNELIRELAVTPPARAGAATTQEHPADQVRQALRPFIDPEKAAFYPTFFKAGPGEYAEGDQFIGVTVPNQRRVAKKFVALPREAIDDLLSDPIHEHRLTGLLILVLQFERERDPEARRAIVDFYLARLDRVNNWDLVDASAHKILGQWLLDKDRSPLHDLADSGHLWRERVSVIACLPLIKNGDFSDILQLAERFLAHPHDLIHKAVGWMLREAGKQDESVLHRFLEEHYRSMPRTMLRYAIEKLHESKRRAYLENRV